MGKGGKNSGLLYLLCLGRRMGACSFALGVNKRWLFMLLALAVIMVQAGCSSSYYIPMLSSEPPLASQNKVKSDSGSKQKHTDNKKKQTDKQQTQTAKNKNQVRTAEKKVVVAKGDTLYSIAKENGVSVRVVIEKNRLNSPYTLSVGQVLFVPLPRYHTVKKGDTIYSISRKYAVDMRALVKLNNLAEPYAISLGQQLLLPQGVVTSNKVAKVNAVQPSETATVVDSPKSQKIVKADGKLSAPPARSSGKFAWPCKGVVVVPFGDLGKGRYNDGVNIKAKKGDKVVAAENGVVAYAGDEIKGFGNLILIKHADGWMTGYAHLGKITVQKNEKVKKRQKIGEVGSTGRVSLPQVHFEVRLGRKAKDPLLYLENK